MCVLSSRLVFRCIHCFVAPSCFYGKDLVSLVNGEQRRIEDLQVGDRVWSIDHQKNRLVEDKIVRMMHNEPNKTGMRNTSVVVHSRAGNNCTRSFQLCSIHSKRSKAIMSV